MFAEAHISYPLPIDEKRSALFDMSEYSERHRCLKTAKATCPDGVKWLCGSDFGAKIIKIGNNALDLLV